MIPRTFPYGRGKRHTIDFFPGDGEGPIVVFIHGGYWQALDGSFFSHCARGLNAHGVGVAIPTYDLCPTVTVDDILGQMRAASRELMRLGRPLVLSGHSAGGHLAACLLATDWPAFDASLPKDPIPAVIRFRACSIGAAGRNVDQQGQGPIMPRPAQPAVLDAAPGREPGCGRRRQRKPRIFPSEPDHCRGMGQQRRCDPVRYHPGCQSFHRNRAVGRSGLAGGIAPEGTGGAVTAASSGFKSLGSANWLLR
jgi:pimeloyl-ACP methyl ester carboxylesterase